MAARERTPEAEIIARCERSRLRQMVDALPEKQRLVFVMSQYLDMRYPEIGDTLSIPEGTVKSRMFHAIRSLRERLAHEGGE
jgi:RNA polymerase sigma-70 factor (ECF subfamily)